MVNEPNEAQTFMTSHVLPAFDEIKARLSQTGREVTVTVYREVNGVSLRALFGGNDEIQYSVHILRSGAVERNIEGFEGYGTPYRIGGFLTIEGRESSISKLTKDDVVRDFFEHYTPRKNRR